MTSVKRKSMAKEKEAKVYKATDIVGKVIKFIKQNSGIVCIEITKTFWFKNLIQIINESK